MFKRKMTTLVLGIALSSQAFAVDPPNILEGRFGVGGLGGLLTAYWGDNTAGPQPTVPPVKLLRLASGQGGGFLPPSGPRPFPPTEELPKILASADLDEHLKGFPQGMEVTLKELGEIIDTIYSLDVEIKNAPDSAELMPEPMSLAIITIAIYNAGKAGHIETKTTDELLDILSSWAK